MLEKLKKIIYTRKGMERRRLPSAGDIPKVGSHIVRRKGVIKVLYPLSQDMWDWLVFMGWREVNMRTNRRKLHMLPDSVFIALVGAPPTMREQVHAGIVAQIRRLTEE